MPYPKMNIDQKLPNIKPITPDKRIMKYIMGVVWLQGPKARI
jgi:hypothetical protein